MLEIGEKKGEPPLLGSYSVEPMNLVRLLEELSEDDLREEQS